MPIYAPGPTTTRLTDPTMPLQHALMPRVARYGRARYPTTPGSAEATINNSLWTAQFHIGLKLCFSSRKAIEKEIDMLKLKECNLYLPFKSITILHRLLPQNKWRKVGQITAIGTIQVHKVVDFSQDDLKKILAKAREHSGHMQGD